MVDRNNEISVENPDVTFFHPSSQFLLIFVTTHSRLRSPGVEVTAKLCCQAAQLNSMFFHSLGQRDSASLYLNFPI